MHQWETVEKNYKSLGVEVHKMNAINVQTKSCLPQ